MIVVDANGVQTIGMAIYERQRELNEICAAAGCKPGTPHREVLDVITIQRAEAAVARRVEIRLRELLPIWRHRARNPGIGSQHYQHGVTTAWEDAARALHAALDGEDE